MNDFLYALSDGQLHYDVSHFDHQSISKSLVLSGLDRPFSSHPAITDSRYYGYQMTVPNEFERRELTVRLPPGEGGLSHI